jgi:hypothetical protein
MSASGSPHSYRRDRRPRRRCRHVAPTAGARPLADARGRCEQPCHPRWLRHTIQRGRGRRRRGVQQRRRSAVVEARPGSGVAERALPGDVPGARSDSRVRPRTDRATAAGHRRCRRGRRPRACVAAHRRRASCEPRRPYRPGAELRRVRRAEAERLAIQNVRFDLRDAADLEPGAYDIVLALDMIHDRRTPIRDAERDPRRAAAGRRAADGGARLLEHAGGERPSPFAAALCPCRSSTA